MNRTPSIRTASCPVALLYNSYAFFRRAKILWGVGKTEQRPIPFTSMPSVSILGWCCRTKELNTCVHEKEHIWKGVCWSIMKIVWHYSNCSEALYLYLPDNATFTIVHSENKGWRGNVSAWSSRCLFLSKTKKICGFDLSCGTCYCCYFATQLMRLKGLGVWGMAGTNSQQLFCTSTVFIFLAWSSSEFLNRSIAIKSCTTEKRKGPFLLSLVGALLCYLQLQGRTFLEGGIWRKPAEDEIIKQDTVQEVHPDKILMPVSMKPVDH